MNIVSRVRLLIMSVVHRLGALRQRRVDGVRDRVQGIAELRAEMQEIRALHQRVAELTDIVAEVLIPLADRDDERVKRALARFQRTSF